MKKKNNLTPEEARVALALAAEAAAKDAAAKDAAAKDAAGVTDAKNAQATDAEAGATPMTDALALTDAATDDAVAEVMAEAMAEAVADAATAKAADAAGGVPTDEEASEAQVLSAFLAALSGKERAALVAALSHLSDAERERERAAARAAEDAAIAEMEKSPAFAGIAARRGEIDALSASVAWLAALPLYERLAAAFYIDRGARYAEPTREDLLSAVLSDGELLRELALRRREAKATVAATLPPTRKTAGAGSTPATVKAPPRSLDEATGEAKKFLRFYK